MRDSKTEFDSRVNQLTEKVVDLQCLNKSQELNDEVNLNVQRMLGYNKALMLD
jgi:hypothetical protein